jgi:hypothetical protein
MKRTACSGIGLVLIFGLLELPASAQNQAPTDQAPSKQQNASSGPSLGDYARQMRKETGTPAKPRVFDNDNLPKEDKLSIVGQAPAANTDSTAEAKDAEPANAASGAGDAKGAEAKSTTQETAAAKDGTKTPQDENAVKQAAWKQWSDKIASQKDQIDLLGRELDVLQREYQIRAAAMYADAGNRLRNSGDWDKQDTQYKQQIADKQKAVDDAKQKLDDLLEDARKAGAPASVREP